MPAHVVLFRAMLAHAFRSPAASACVALLAILTLVTSAAGGVAASSTPGDPAMLGLARMLNAERRFAAADSVAGMLIERASSMPAVDSLPLADALMERGFARTRLRRFEPRDVRGQLESTGRLVRRLVPAGDRRVALAEILLAECLIDDPASCIEHARSAVRILEAGPAVDDTLLARAWIDVGELQLAQGHAAEAMDALTKGRALKERLYGPDALELVSAEHDVARAQYLLGLHDEAIATATHALRALDAHTTRHDDRRMGPLNILAVAHTTLGDWPEALAAAQEAADVAASNADTLRLVPTRLNVAGILADANDWSGARTAYEEVLRLIEQSPGGASRYRTLALESLANACDDQGDAPGAARYFAAAEAELIRQPGADSSTTLARCLVGRSNAPARQQRYAETLGLLRRASVINDRARRPDPTTLVASRTRAIRVVEARGDTTGLDSLRAELVAVRDRHRLDRTGQGPVITHWLARVDGDRGRADAAWAEALAADEGIRSQVRRSAARMSDARALDLARRKPYVLSHLLSLAGGDRPERWPIAWDRLVRTRGLIGAELSRRRLSPALLADSSIGVRHAAWVGAQRVLARDLARGGAVDSAALAAHRDAADRAERSLAQALAGRAALPAAAEPTLAEVRSALPAGAALVGFAEVVGTDEVARLVAFVARAGEPGLARIELGNVDSLRALVDPWRERLGSRPGASPRERRRAESACRSRGLLVRSALWDRLVPALGDASEVIVIGDGPVVDLPFHALPDARAGYLVESGPLVRVLQAERELLARPAIDSPPVLLAMGDPAFERTTTDHVSGSLGSADPCAAEVPRQLAPLPATRIEARQIAATWTRTPGRTAHVLLGTEASESAFRALAPQAGVVHIATHGVVLGDRCRPGTASRGLRGVGGVDALGAPAHPVRQRPAAAPPDEEPSPWSNRRVLLALASSAGSDAEAAEREDGLLTAEEIVTLNLAGTDWVVLSACHSGFGEPWTREGALGMRRAFTLAGARSVVASQWAVEDRATAEWMTALYRARAAGASHASVAARRASQEVLAERRHTHRSTHPFYWAGFVASGE